MADDRGLQPAPRPRRRRTDIDPNAPSPPVANERRRQNTSGAGASPAHAVGAAAALAAIPGGVTAAPTARTESSTDAKDFRVPGLAAIALTERDEAVVTVAPTEVPTDDGRSWLQVLDDRSPDPNVCPFLRATGQSGLIAPIETPDTTNRCAALAEAVPQSLRQQELVCLSTGHVNCPRYLRGAAVMAETPKPVVREGRALSPAMLGSLVVLVLALSASVGFVLARGGALDIAPPGLAASPSPSSVAAASPSAASGAPVVAPTSSSSSASVTPSPTPSVTPSPTPTPSATPAPTATPTPRASPKSDRYRLLRACPSTPRCWIYKVRSGDNLFSISRYFGVSQDSIYARNPWLRSRGLRSGQELRLPPPTR